jgi:hypothetical protein
MSRTCLIAAAGIAVLALGWAARVATMKAALRTVTPEEDGFIDRVVDKMNRNILPRKLVESTFLWAKKQPNHKFQYFKRSLILRAARQGIKVK